MIMKRLLLLSIMMCCSFAFGQNYQFLGEYDSLGVPLYLESPGDVVTQATHDLVNNSLPESYPVPIYNPQYISAGYDTDIELLEVADVWVTFVKEGAGYKNVLGFYTYDINNPYTSAPQPEDITIIFPNASEGGYGGGLSAGNKVKIGTFPAGTGIGWVLLANGWNGSAVTGGAWQLFSNPDFNPEADPELRHHNVLLSDPENERVLLSFEDIRRDYQSCDNDFNDVVFYVTSNPYTAMKLVNVADVDSANDVSSANDGGLESNGSLAGLIANRNFTRAKNNSFLNRKQLQNPYVSSNSILKNGQTVNFSALLPTTGMFGTETPYVSSPEDLTQITNAEQVFSVDYYSGSERVAAALATQTTGGVYDHSKAICDRLNGSSLEDVRTIKLQGHELIMSKIKRANGITEYALTFSIQQTETISYLHSYWNIGQYPAGDYLNFQVWGSNMGQVSSITNYILTQLAEDNTVTDVEVENRIPQVFVKNGIYKDGSLNLEIVNKTASLNLNFEGNKRITEQADVENITEGSILTGDYNQSLVVQTGSLFDIGFSVNTPESVRTDALYLADGPWGIDYDAQVTGITSFTVQPYEQDEQEGYNVERNASLTGQTSGTVNLFRNILAGELTLDVSDYEALNFTLQNSHTVEVVLVTENLTDWENRLTYQLPAHSEGTVVSIPLSAFQNLQGESFNGERVRSIVFSVISGYMATEDFDITVSDMSFGAQTLSVSEFETLHTNIFNYPNPFKGSTTVVLPEDTEVKHVTFTDMLGRTIVSSGYKKQTSGKELLLANINLPEGIYMMNVTTVDGKVYQTRCMIR